MKKRGFERVALEKETAAKKKDELPEQINYDLIVIKSLTGKVTQVTKDMKSVCLSFNMKYVHNVEKIYENEMEKAVSNKKSVSLSTIISKYESKKKRPSLDSDSDSSSDSEHDSDSSSDTGSDSSMDSTKDMEAGDDDEDIEKAHKKGTLTSKFSMFVNIHKLPTISPYASFLCTVKEGKKIYPPDFDSIYIEKVRNTYKSVGTLSAVRVIHKIANWIGNLDIIIKDVKMHMLNDKAECLDDITGVFSVPAQKGIAVMLFRDVFRHDAFYWFMGLVPTFKLREMTDAFLSLAMKNIMSGNIVKHLFSEVAMPLVYSGNLATRRDVAKCCGDIEKTPAIIHANKLWHFWWTRIGLYQGRFVWTLNEKDVPTDMARPDMTSAVEYLMSCNSVTRIVLPADKGYVYIPAFATRHWSRLSDSISNGRVIVHVFEGDVADISSYLGSIRDWRSVENTAVCPTVQSCRYVLRTTNMTVYHAGKRVLSDFVTFCETHTSFILVDVHNWAAHMLENVFEAIDIAHKRKHASRPFCIILCGCKTLTALEESHGRGSTFDHLLSSAFVLNTKYGRSEEPRLTLDLIRSSALSPLVFGVSRKISILSAILAYDSRNHSSVLSNHNLDVVSAAIRTAFPTNPDVVASATPLLLFDSYKHMVQIVAHPNLAGVFETGSLFVSQIVKDSEGGVRRVAGLWISLRKGVFSEVPSVDIDSMQPESVYYRLQSDDADVRTSLSAKPIVPLHYTCISKLRSAPLCDIDVFGVFTSSGERFSASDIQKLVFLAPRRLCLFFLGMAEHACIFEYPPSVNVFDVARKME